MGVQNAARTPDVMCCITGLRLARLVLAISSELHRLTPDAQRVELLELQQAELRHLRDELKPDDARTISRHIAHFGQMVREHDDRQTDTMTNIALSSMRGSHA